MTQFCKPGVLVVFQARILVPIQGPCSKNIEASQLIYSADDGNIDGNIDEILALN